MKKLEQSKAEKAFRDLKLAEQELRQAQHNFLIASGWALRPPRSPAGGFIYYHPYRHTEANAEVALAIERSLQ